MLLELIQGFFFPYSSTKMVNTSSDYCHVLDVYRKILLWEKPEFEAPPHVPTPGRHDVIIRSAREIHEAGIQIKMSKTRSPCDISFHGGILRLPVFVVDNLTESLFSNLIAFERFQAGIGLEVTSYIFFMAKIINNARDASFLSSLGIIQNGGISTDEDIAQLFKLLSRDILLDPHSPVCKILEGLQSYCNRRYNRWRAYILGTYFRNPWASISLIASIVLFVLTLVQTMYAVVPYYRK